MKNSVDAHKNRLDIARKESNEMDDVLEDNFQDAVQKGKKMNTE